MADAPDLASSRGAVTSVMGTTSCCGAGDDLDLLKASEVFETRERRDPGRLLLPWDGRREGVLGGEGVAGRPRTLVGLRRPCVGVLTSSRAGVGVEVSVGVSAVSFEEAEGLWDAGAARASSRIPTCVTTTSGAERRRGVSGGAPEGTSTEAARCRRGVSATHKAARSGVPAAPAWERLLLW